VAGNTLLLILVANSVELLDTRDPQTSVRFSTPDTILRFLNVIRLYDDRAVIPAVDKHPKTVCRI
jgi:hypothetical protein